MKPNHIRPIAICLFRNGDKILVSDGIDPKTGGAYCRPLGGTIEFGELAANALVRALSLRCNTVRCATLPIFPRRHAFEQAKTTVEIRQVRKTATEGDLRDRLIGFSELATHLRHTYRVYEIHKTLARSPVKETTKPSAG